MTEEKTRVGIVMPVDLKNDVKELAKTKGLDLSSFIRLVLTEEVNKNK
ncbi:MULTISPECIES: hypothetical protein [Lactobacillales]|jgi:post-segregation antitoxin (ccd killing protein)|nr:MULTISPECIES: hypothetical protein [Lactobacillales]EGP5019754.1 hypothetical protein [Enterococcus faecium]NVZ01861.1 hypothetical protein [Pediococcus pentosaceus]